MMKETAMTHATTHNHDLEDHIEELHKLDEVRKRSAELRDEGIEVLMECLHTPEKDEKPPAFGDWRRERSLVVRALLTLQDQPISDEEKEAKRLNLIESLINQLQNNFTLNDLEENELSVLMAASVLRALTAQPGAAFSRTAMLCYYWIIRELYSANRSDWNIGGARAASGGLVTAFTTGECVRALWSFAEAQRNTGKFIEEAGKYLERIEQLEKLNDHYFPAESNPKPLEEWVEAEKERLRLSCFLNLRRLSRYLVLPLDPSEIILYDPYIMSIKDDELKKGETKKFLIENAQFLNKNAVLIVEVSKGTEWIIAGLNDKGEPKIEDAGDELKKELKNKKPDTDKIIELSKSCLNLKDNKTINKFIMLSNFKDTIRDKIEKVKVDFSKALKEIREYREVPNENIGEGEDAVKIRDDLMEYLYGCGLRMRSVCNEEEQNKILDEFKSEFESKKKECPLLIVNSASVPDQWMIAGFNDVEQFQHKFIKDTSNELSVEWKKKPAN